MKNGYYKMIGSVFYDINDSVVFYVWIRQCPDSYKKFDVSVVSVCNGVSNV